MAYTKSEDITELAGALSVAQGAIENALKDSSNPFFKSSYADLASVWDAIRAPISANGLSIMQLPSADGPKVTITTLIAHKSGQWVSSDLTVTAKEDTPQAVGSAITYARRYALQSVAGVAPEDDDGNGANGRNAPPPQRREVPKTQPRPTPPPTQPRTTQPSTEETLRKSIDDAIAKIYERYEAMDAKSTFKGILGSHGYTEPSEIPADYSKAKGVVDELKATLKDLVPA